MATETARESDAAVIGVYAAVAYDVISATNSSPQTTEINAKTRAGTLMKWVHIGLVQAVLFTLMGMFAEKPGKRWRPLIGGGTASVMLWFQYRYALRAGLESTAPPTEDTPLPGSPSTNGTGRIRTRGSVDSGD